MTEWLRTWPSWLFDKNTNQFTVVGKILLSAAFIIVSYFIIKLIVILLKKVFGIKNKLDIDTSAKSFFINTIKILLWILVSFIVCQIIGLNLSSFAGILSAITVALGLALQDVISCFASGLIIFNQKHLSTGDYVEIKSDIGEACGTIQKVSLMTTVLKNANGQIITISNANVRKAIVTNFTKNKIRRISMTVPVSYEADPKLVKETLTRIITSDSRVLKDPEPNIHYNELGDFSIRVAIKCWTKCSDYWDVFNALHEKILLEFRKNKIEIPKITSVQLVKKD